MPWIKLRGDGSVAHQLHDRPRNARGWHETDRIGDLAVETWTPESGWTPRDAVARGVAIDAGHAADHGQWRRLIDYAVKQVEARVVLGTLATEGLLAREAALRGMTVEDLARAVIARADAADVEMARVAAKIGEAKR